MSYTSHIDAIKKEINHLKRDEKGVLIIPDWYFAASHFVIALCSILMYVTNDTVDAVLQEVIDILEEV